MNVKAEHNFSTEHMFSQLAKPSHLTTKCITDLVVELK